jgi:SAM-dependent methyltransferase
VGTQLLPRDADGAERTEACVVIEAESLSWTGYIYGGLAHSSTIQYSEKSELTGEGSARRGLVRMGLTPEWVKGKRVLETGTGMYGLGFARLGATVEHRNIATGTIDALNAYARQKSFGTLSAMRSDLVEDELPQEHFDLIYLSGVYQHLSDPVRALENAARALKVGGYLYLDVYRSGRWRFFVMDMLRRFLQHSDLQATVARFAESCVLAGTRSFQLRQLELLVDDLFVEHVHLFRPADVIADAQALGLRSEQPVTSMNLVDDGTPVDHSLFFAHVFNTMTFKKTEPSPSTPLRAFAKPRCQLAEIERLGGSYADIVPLTAEFVLAHQSGRFDAATRASHAANLYRMAHPCMVGDLYFEPGTQEPSGATHIDANVDAVRARRHGLWAGFLANALGKSSPLNVPEVPTLGFELVRFLRSES